MHLINGQKTEKKWKMKKHYYHSSLHTSYVIIYNTILLHRKQEKNIRKHVFSLPNTKRYNFLCTKQIRHYNGEI
jgi:hypothetical protein